MTVNKHCYYYYYHQLCSPGESVLFVISGPDGSLYSGKRKKLYRALARLKIFEVLIL